MRKKKQPVSGLYLLADGMRLAHCNIYLCYFLHKVKNLTPFFPIAGVCHPSILCIKKAHQKAHFEKKEATCIRFVFSGARVQFGMRLAQCNIYLCYLLHKIKNLTPSSHKWPSHTVIWIQFVFIEVQAHFIQVINDLLIL